jgi:hypothetical protein
MFRHVVFVVSIIFKRLYGIYFIIWEVCRVFYVADVRNGRSITKTEKEERNILRTIKRRKGNWIGHILRRNCLLKHVMGGNIEGSIKVTGRRGRRRKLLLDDISEREDIGN